MKSVIKLVKGRSGMLGLGASVGSMVTRVVDGSTEAGMIIGLGVIIYVIVTVVSNLVLKDDKK